MQRLFCAEPHLCAQLAFTDAEDSARVPHCERARGALANRGNPVACDSGLIMNDGNLSADQAIEQRGLAYVWPADNCDIRRCARLIHRSRHIYDFAGWAWPAACNCRTPSVT